MPHKPCRALFLCTGNYYRSRFAELLFNERARERGLSWRADSAGLACQCSLRNAGDISPDAREGLRALGIACPDRARPPRDATLADLESADCVIALSEREHRPMLLARFPALTRRVVYWQVEDIGLVSPRLALAEIERQVERLLGELESMGCASRGVRAAAEAQG